MGERYSTIVATGAAIPGKNVPGAILTNANIVRMLDTLKEEGVPGTSEEWIKDMTGIETRRISRVGVKHLFIAAGEDAFKNCENLPEEQRVSPGDIGLVVGGRNTLNDNDYSDPDNPIEHPPLKNNSMYPAKGALFGGHFKMQNFGALDVQSGCAGGGSAQVIVDLAIRYGLCDCGVQLGGDFLSDVTDWSDRQTCVLLADGAGAFILRVSDRPGILSHSIQTVPDVRGDLTEVYKKGRKLIYVGGNDKDAVWELGPEVYQNFLTMRGKRIWRWAVGSDDKKGAVENGLEEALSRGTSELERFFERVKGSDLEAEVLDLSEAARKVKAGYQLSYEDIDILSPHQANLRIIEKVSEKTKVPMEKILVTINKYGNTSPGSDMVAFHEGVQEGKVKPGDLVLSARYGSGSTVVCSAMIWNPNAIYSS